MTFLNQKENMEFLARAGADISPIRSVAHSPVFTRPDTPQHEEYFIKAMDHARPLPAFVHDIQIAAVVKEQLRMMFERGHRNQ